MKDTPLKDILAYILTHITLHPEEVTIEESIENGAKLFTVKTNPEDTGRVIGKEGKIIKAIRAIMRVAAIQRAERVRVVVISQDDQTTAEPTETTETTESSPQLESEDSDSIDLTV